MTNGKNVILNLTLDEWKRFCILIGLAERCDHDKFIEYKRRLTRDLSPKINAQVMAQVGNLDMDMGNHPVGACKWWERPVFVVGGGPSLSGFDFSLLDDYDTIAVNKAVFSIKDPTYFITIDYTFLRKIDKAALMRMQCPKFFIANYDNSYIKDVNGAIVDTRFNLVYNLKDFDVIVKSKSSHGIGLTFSDFRNGVSSGFCGLQLAVLLGYTRIYLLGIDLSVDPTVSGGTHYHGGYGEPPDKFAGKLDRYFQEFKHGLGCLRESNPNVSVISCSLNSRLNEVIKYGSLEEVFDGARK